MHLPYSWFHLLCLALPQSHPSICMCTPVSVVPEFFRHTWKRGCPCHDQFDHIQYQATMHIHHAVCMSLPGHQAETNLQNINSGLRPLLRRIDQLRCMACEHLHTYLYCPRRNQGQQNGIPHLEAYRRRRGNCIESHHSRGRCNPVLRNKGRVQPHNT